MKPWGRPPLLGPGQFLNLDPEAGQRASDRAAHLRADEEAVGEPGEGAPASQPVVELLRYQRGLARDLEPGHELPGALRVPEGDPVQAAGLVLQNVLGDLPPPRRDRAPAQ